MTPEQEKGIMQAFDAYCKTVLRNKARNLHKELTKQNHFEIPIEDLADFRSCACCRDLSVPAPFPRRVVPRVLYAIQRQGDQRAIEDTRFNRYHPP